MSDKNHFGILDGIRGFLAFWVFAYHFSIACIGKPTPWGSGAVAVDIFMLLSGFLMAYHWSMREHIVCNFKKQLSNFYTRRFFRIAPLYYLLLPAAFLGHEYFYEISGYINNMVLHSSWLPNTENTGYISVSTLDVFLHYTFLFGFIPQYAASNMIPDWSIGLEMQFYLVFPFIMMAISRFGAFSTVVVIVIIAMITNGLVGLYLDEGILGNFPQPSLILFKINIFMAGISLALAYLNKDSIKCIPWIILLVLSLAGTQIQVWAASLFILFMFNFDFDKKELLNRLMSSKFMKFLGDTSYAVYLIHRMIYLPVLYYLFQLSWFVDLGTYSRLVVGFLCAAAITYSTAYFLYRFIEIPGINFGRKILSRRKN